MNRYREVAEDLSFLLTDCDEQQQDIPKVLGHMAHQLAALGFPLKRFDERYKVYRQKMDEIEQDPEVPAGLAGLLGRTVVRGAFAAGDLVPGLRKGLEYLPQDTIETQFSEWSAYIAKKLTNKDEIALLREPVAILTPLFFRDLNEIAEKQRVLLCFENFEETRANLQPWLLRLGEYKPSHNIRIAIASRTPPGAKWDSLRSITLTLPIDVFNEQEAEQFLDTYGVVDAKRRAEILEFSGRLPVLMSWLAAPESADPDPAMPASDIVERFLRWVSSADLRLAALLGSIPRLFNLEIIKMLLEDSSKNKDVQIAFDWLRTMPFVKAHASGWQYHSVVRRMMLYYQRQESPQAYCHTHGILANFYGEKCALSEYLSKDNKWPDEKWQKTPFRIYIIF